MNLRQDAGDKAFHLVDGSIVRTVEELRNKLLRIAENDYSHHVNAERSDFSTWVREVYKDKRLAGELSKAKSPLEASKAITKRLAELTPKVVTTVVKAPKQKQELKNATRPKPAKIRLPKNKPKKVAIKKKAAKTKSISSHKQKGGLIGLVSKNFKKSNVPDAHKFLTAYLAMQRPTALSHFYFTKGMGDFLMGMVIGVLIGIVIGNIF
ncbi:hypothetical protein JXB11_00400 [Candidatus Woesearchaeota archaeon]|nr:hypothetical protein [Candidatus Woesearchaeota archaeon]